MSNENQYEYNDIHFNQLPTRKSVRMLFKIRKMLCRTFCFG